MKTEKKTHALEEGRAVVVQTPLIVSASRATDIPAFYSQWFFNRLRDGYIRWRNPYSGKDSLQKANRTLAAVHRLPQLPRPYPLPRPPETPPRRQKLMVKYVII